MARTVKIRLRYALLVALAIVASFSFLASGVLSAETAFTSNCTATSQATCGWDTCSLVCRVDIAKAVSAVPAMTVSANSNIVSQNYQLWENISHPKMVCNKCTWNETGQNELNKTVNISHTDFNCDKCGSTLQQNYYYDYVSPATKATIAPSKIVKYIFKVKPQTSGKFNINIDDGTVDKVSIDPFYQAGTYRYCRNITIDRTNTSLTNFPIPITVNDTTLTYSLVSAGVIQPVDTYCNNNGTALMFGKEKWNTTGNSTFWISANTSNTDNTVYSLYFGNLTTTTTTENMTAVWDSNTVAVFLFNETSGNLKDYSTTNLSQISTTVSQRLVSGITDGAYNYSTNGDYSYFTGSSPIEWGSKVNYSIQLWFNRPTGTSYAIRKILSGGKGWYIGLNENKAGALKLQQYADVNSEIFTAGTGYLNNQWQFAVAQRDGSTCRIYMNGTYENSSSCGTGSAAGTGGNMDVGGCYDYASYSTKALDTIILSNIARSSDWINASYYAQGSGIYTLGTLEEDFKTINITISSPSNSTTTNSSIPLSFTTTSPDFSGFNCSRVLDAGSSVDLGNLTNNTLYNYSIPITQGSHNINMTCQNDTTYGTNSIYFSTIDFATGTDGYSTPVWEHSWNIFNLTITNNSNIANANATLFWNLTEYPSVATYSGGQWFFNTTFLTPFITSNGTGINFNWSYSVQYSNGTYITINNVGSHSQQIYQTSFHIGAYDENTLAQLNFNLTITNSTHTNQTNSITSFDALYSDPLLPKGSLIITVIATGHPARTYYTTYSGDNYNLTAYLAPTTTGQYVNFFTVNTAEQAISGVQIDILRFIGTSWIIVGSKLTDTTGSGTFFMDYTHSYEVNAYKNGYLPSNNSLTPSQTSYKIYMTTNGTLPAVNYTNSTFLNVSISREPIGSALYWKVYTLNYTITDRLSDLDFFGMRLYYCPSTCTLLYSLNNTTSSIGGQIAPSYNMSGQNGTLIMDTWFSRQSGLFTWRENKTYVIYNTTTIGQSNTSLGALIEEMATNSDYKLDVCNMADPLAPCGFAFGIVSIFLMIIAMAGTGSYMQRGGGAVIGLIVLAAMTAIGTYVYGTHYWFGWATLTLIALGVVIYMWLKGGGF